MAQMLRTNTAAPTVAAHSPNRHARLGPLSQQFARTNGTFAVIARENQEMVSQDVETYGYENYETGMTAVYLGNDRETQERAREIARADFQYGHQREDAMRDYVADDPPAEFHENMRGITLHRVNWAAIIDTFNED